jgi:hypothetical protein
MNIGIDFTTTEVKVKIDTDKEFSYLMEQSIDLTEFVKSISESISIINIEPDKSVLLQQETGTDANKLVGYIIKIIDAFNEAFNDANKKDE